MCQISFSITDHGLIEAEGFIAPGDDPPTLTILGGTLEYDGVGGRLFVGSGQHPATRSTSPDGPGSPLLQVPVEPVQDHLEPLDPVDR